MIHSISTFTYDQRVFNTINRLNVSDSSSARSSRKYAFYDIFVWINFFIILRSHLSDLKMFMSKSRPKFKCISTSTHFNILHTTDQIFLPESKITFFRRCVVRIDMQSLWALGMNLVCLWHDLNHKLNWIEQKYYEQVAIEYYLLYCHFWTIKITPYLHCM